MVQGFLERNNTFTRETVKEFRTMQKVTKRIEKTVDSFLDLSHSEGNEYPKPININELIKNTVSLLSNSLRQKIKILS